MRAYFNEDPTTKRNLLLLIVNKAVNPLSTTFPITHSSIFIFLGLWNLFKGTMEHPYEN